MRLLSMAMVVAGVILLIYGVNASESFASEVKQTFTGNPTDRSMWFIIGGAVLAVIGLGSFLRRGKLN